MSSPSPAASPSAKTPSTEAFTAAALKVLKTLALLSAPPSVAAVTITHWSKEVLGNFNFI